jgi:hypothetical protein
MSNLAGILLVKQGARMPLSAKESATVATRLLQACVCICPAVEQRGGQHCARHGEGTCMYANCDVYKGSWRNYIWLGTGTYTAQTMVCMQETEGDGAG